MRIIADVTHPVLTLINSSNMNYCNWVWAALALTCVACRQEKPCTPPLGRWTDREGREWQFLQDGRAMWLTRFGSQYDTSWCAYELRCDLQPATLEMRGFTSGPFREAQVFAIFEWSNDSTLRFQYEKDNRPGIFSSEKAVKLYQP